MIQVVTNRQIFEYDVHSLFKAFYPGEDVSIIFQACEDPSDDGIFTGFFVAYHYEGRLEITVSHYADGLETEKRDTSLSLSQAEDRGLLKNTVKRTVYDLLHELTGVQLPWGTLTGIRPTKLAMMMRKDGLSDEVVAQKLRSTYLMSGQKIDLSLSIIDREEQVIKRSHGARGFSLYIGIPFCPTTCLYCSFTSYPIAAWQKKLPAYFDALNRELAAVSELFRDRPLDSLYIGGGTPTTLEPVLLKKLMGMIRDAFDLSSVPEFTVEAGRPDSITAEKLQVLKEEGVNRISINPQTMNEETLRLIGRRHTVEQIYESFALARSLGFDNINTDLILGLPGEGLSAVRHTFTEIKKLSPDAVTVHAMALKRAAGMAEYLKAHEEIKSENTAEMMAETETAAEAMGLKPYYLYRQKNIAGNFENVGYAREGCYGIYNILMMEEVQDIVALGPGTVTKRVFFNKETGEITGLIKRCDNVKDVAMYIDRIDEMIERKRLLFNE
ncbi:MAG: coproporphyrinogen dehydrogenase HemZ [Lachnospiraceae bacterium]|nr:coproporphyrinogen dehydrogenase HemZ [Lachnospiraceae bacterium]